MVVRGPWPDPRPPLTDALFIEAHILDVCRDRPGFGTRRVTAMVGRPWAARGLPGASRTATGAARDARAWVARAATAHRARRARRTQRDLALGRALGDDLSKIATREGWLWIVGVIGCHDRDLVGRRYGSQPTRRCAWAHRRARGRERTACPRLREPSVRSGLFTQHIETLQGACDAVAGSQTRRRGLGPLALSPLPRPSCSSPPCWGAAPLMPLSAASFAGRVASYSICSAPLPRR